jgi:hypothetical protein
MAVGRVTACPEAGVDRGGGEQRRRRQHQQGDRTCAWRRSHRPYAKQALHAIVSCVEVNDETIRIVRANEQLSQLVSSEGSDPEEGPPGVPSVRGYIRRWRRECQSIPPDVQAVFHSSTWEPTVLATSHWPIPCARCAPSLRAISVDLDAAAPTRPSPPAPATLSRRSIG